MGAVESPHAQQPPPEGGGRADGPSPGPLPNNGPAPGPRPAEVGPDGTAHVADAERLIPIVIVPGIMGTRLVRRTAQGGREMVWNPRAEILMGALGGDDAGSFTGNYAAIADTRTACQPDEGWFPHDDARRHDEARSFGQSAEGSNNPNQRIGSLYNLIEDYHGLARALAETGYLPAGHRPRVFCAGYDWRMSSRQSATRLSTVCDVARNVCHSEQVILVAHSMGGLVSRAYCRLGAEAAVRALFLIASPTLGAPESYASLKGGLTSRDFELRQFALSPHWAAPHSAEQSAQLLRLIPSTYELMPNRVYGAQNPRWLGFAPDRAGFTGPVGTTPQYELTACDRVEQLYTDPYAGIADGATLREGNDDAYWEHRVQRREFVRRKVLEAIAFQDFLLRGGGAYMHPRTYLTFSNRHSTITGVNLDATECLSNRYGHWYSSTLATVEQAAGDQTVPMGSAAPTGCSPPPLAAVPLPANHVDMPSHAQTIRYLKDRIAEEVRLMTGVRA